MPCFVKMYRPRGGGGGETICPPPDGSSTVVYSFAVVDPIIPADLRPSADGSAVRASLVAGGG